MPRKSQDRVPVVLTIAGSDSGGGAGIQADLKTFSAFRVFGTSAITCVTAQNPDGVEGIEAMDAAMVSLQIRTVCAGFPIQATKTGMLYSASIIRATAQTLRLCKPGLLVVDPVMVATSGARLLREDAMRALCADLLPMARVITPNVPEAEVLWGQPIRSLNALKAAARAIGEQFGCACVAKGGHLTDVKSVVCDVLFDGGATRIFSSPRVRVSETHGTGCTFSAALTACLARGMGMAEAVRRSRAFVIRALQKSPLAGKHHPLGIPPVVRRD